jgi:hypothetical protein
MSYFPGLSDGADVNAGSTTDVAVTGDSAGTQSAKLRGLLKILSDIWDSVNHRIKVDGSGVTQPVSGSVAVSNLPTTQAVSGSVSVGNFPATQTVSGTVSVGNFPATQAISATSLPLPTSAAQDGTDGTGITQPTGGAGIRGWLSGIYHLLSTTLTVSISGTPSVSISGTPSIANTAFTANAGTNLNNSALALDTSITTVNSNLTTLDADIKSNITLHAGSNTIGSVKVTDGTNSPNVTPATAASNAIGSQASILTAGAFAEVSATNVASSNGDLVPAMDVSNFRSFSLQLTGTWTGVINIQGSNDNVNWFTLSAISIASNGGLVTNIVSNGQMVGALNTRYFRVRMTTYTSGTGASSVCELYTQPSFFTALTANCIQNGTWATTAIPNAATTGGASLFHGISAASTNATSIKASAAQLYGYQLSNTNAAARYVKFFNKASAPTLGTDIPVRTVLVPANSQVNGTFVVGGVFATGLALATTTGMADLDTSAVGAGDLSIDIDYK